jgi:hypothetical protein
LLRAYDPGGDGHENDGLAPAARADGDPTTNWQTECYGDRYFGKEGVGLVVDLAAPSTGTLSFQVATAPFQVRVYASDDATLPDDIDGWHAVGSKIVGAQSQPVNVTIGTLASHLLIWFLEGGISSTCSTAHPHRAVVGEVAFTGSG